MPGLLRWLLMLVLLACAGAPVAEPIALSQPFDLAGKRVLVVVAMGRSAMLQQPNGRVLGTSWSSREAATPLPPSIRLDALVAREAVAKLESFGATAEIVDLDYRDEDLYDLETMVRNTKLPWFNLDRRNAWATDLLHKRDGDALLFVHAGSKFVTQYVPPIVGYGLYMAEDFTGCRVVMAQALFLPDKQTPRETRMANGVCDPVKSLVFTRADDSDKPPEPTAEQWSILQPPLEDAAARVTRALVSDLRVRVLNTRKSANDRRTTAPLSEPGVMF